MGTFGVKTGLAQVSRLLFSSNGALGWKETWEKGEDRGTEMRGGQDGLGSMRDELTF